MSGREDVIIIKFLFPTTITGSYQSRSEQLLAELLSGVVEGPSDQLGMCTLCVSYCMFLMAESGC